MEIKEASIKWKISERRIRKLILDGRIEKAKKIGNTWYIPDDTIKPIDKRFKDNTKFIINLDKDYFNEIDEKYRLLNSKRPFSKEALEFLQDAINLEWIYNSNAIEGNKLTLKETRIVLEGITVGGKTIKDHLETINHEYAINYLEELVKDNSDITEWTIKELHQLILKGISDEYAGKYRDYNVLVKGAKHRPPNYLIVPELMEKLIISYHKWDNYHPIIKSVLLHGELVKIHPFTDGNGRVSRLLMNMELMKNGYVPVLIELEDRLKYYEVIDNAHITGDYTDFIKLVTEKERNMLDRYLNIIN